MIRIQKRLNKVTPEGKKDEGKFWIKTGSNLSEDEDVSDPRQGEWKIPKNKGFLKDRENKIMLNNTELVYCGKRLMNEPYYLYLSCL